MLELRRNFEADHATDLADAHDVSVLAAVFPLNAATPVQPETVDLEIPGWIWGTMALCYGLFFGGLFAASGHDGEAIFAIVISLGYAVMYFGTASILFGMNPPRQPSAFMRGLAPLQTWTGEMDTTAVAAQILTVPACLAFFGIAAAIIRAAIMG
jgi:hypothetical protein